MMMLVKTKSKGVTIMTSCTERHDTANDENDDADDLEHELQASSVRFFFYNSFIIFNIIVT